MQLFANNPKYVGNTSCSVVLSANGVECKAFTRNESPNRGKMTRIHRSEHRSNDWDGLSLFYGSNGTLVGMTGITIFTAAMHRSGNPTYARR